MTETVAKVDPETLAIRSRPPRAIRFKRGVIIAIAAIGSISLIAVTWMALRPHIVRPADRHLELTEPDPRAGADSLSGTPATYGDVPRLGPPLPGDLGPAIVKAQQPMGSGIDPEQAERLAAEEAARSSVFFRSSGSAGGVKPGVAEAAGTVDPAVLATGNQPFNPMGAMGSAPAAPTDPTAVQNRQDQKEAFLAKAGDASTRNPGSLQLPTSPYQVMAGTVIPAALVTGINSDLPGQVIANVTEAVYDTATGRHLLIPQGSRLIGRYDSQVAFGQRRVLLVWTRLILPDCRSLDLARLPGTDPAGQAGLEDRTDFHWGGIMRAAAVSTLLAVGAEWGSDSDDTLVRALRQGGQDSVNRAGTQIVARALDVPGLPHA